MKKFLLTLTAVLTLLPMFGLSTPSGMVYPTTDMGYGSYYYANVPVTQVPLVIQTRPTTPMSFDTMSDNRDTQSFTVNDGTATVTYVPLYGLYADYGAKGQFIIPASDLSAIPTGTPINKLKFYSKSTSSATYFGVTVIVQVAEVSNTTFSSASFVTSGLTTVYSGTSLSRSADGTMEVTFSNPYTYNGGNLLISIGGYGSSSSSTSWYCVSKSSAGVYGYNSSNSQTIPTSATNTVAYAPKVTIFYGDSSGGDDPDPEGCKTEDFTNTTATGISDEGSVPTGWMAYTPGYTGAQGYVPHVVNSTLYAHINGNFLFFKAGSSCENVYAIMPKYEGLASVSFKYVYEYLDYGTLTLGYVTANTEAGCSSFVTLTDLTSTESVTTYTLTETQLNTINSANGYIAFKYNKTSTWYSAAIDDVTVCTEQGAYTVTCADATGGTVTATPTHADEGATITVTATPEGGYTLTSLSYTTDGGTTVVITGNTFTMPADNVTVHAVFTANTSYNITYNVSPAGTGTATGPASAPWGSEVTVTTVPASGYVFDHLTVTGSGGNVTASGKTFTMPQYNVTVTAYFVEGGVSVTLDDRENHNWVYYKDSESPIHRLNPVDIKITYYGNGTNNMTTTNTDNMPANSAFNADATGVAVNVGNVETEGTFIYYKTLENANEGGTGNYPYTLIPNPFQVRPTYGSGSTRYRGFYAWRVKSLTGVTIKSSDGSTTYGVNSFIYPEEEIQFVTTNEYNNEVEFEALWARAYVNTTSTSERATNSGRYQNAYERNFKVVTSLTTYDYPVTISTVYPDGTGTVGTITASADYSCTEDVKLENMNLNMSSNYLNGNGYNFAIGRGVTNGSNNVANAIYGDHTTATSTSYFTLRVESGKYPSLYGLYNTSSATEISSAFKFNLILGSDYDRASVNNSKLVISGSVGLSYYVYCSSSSTKLNVKAYSGSFGANTTDMELYLGFQNNGSSNCLAVRSAEILGGDFLGGIAGGIENGVSTDTKILNVRIKGGSIAQYMYGAGQYSEAYGSRSFVVTGGTFTGWIAGGCYGTNSSGGATDGNTYVYFGGKANQTSNEGIFGAGYGSSATGTGYYTVAKSYVVIADEAKVAGNVYAGGNNGYTTGNAEVYVKGTSLNVSGNIFGGANKARSSANTKVTVKGGTILGSVYGGANTSGTVSGQATVKVSGGTINSNVFGGGCGASTQMSSKSTVEISDNGYVAGNVFGGGELGKSTTSVINMYGGSVNGNIFGGALGTSGSVMMTGNKTVNIMGGAVKGSVYGGSRNANDSKDSYVNISGGTINKNVYGGGFYGSISGNTFVNIGKNAIISSANGSSGGSSGANGVEVINGTDQLSYVPLYTLYCDHGSKGEFLIPASYMSNAGITAGTQLTSMTLTQAEGKEWVVKNLKVKLLNTTLSAYSSTGFLGNNGTQVYSSNSFSANNEPYITFQFSSAFTYNGGGLIVQLSCETGGTYKSSYWLGVTTTTDQGYYGYNSSSSNTDYTSGNTLQKFLPNVAFETASSSSGSGSSDVIAGGTNSDKQYVTTPGNLVIGESVYAGSDWGEFTAGSTFMAPNITGVSNIFVDATGYTDGNLIIGNSIYGSGTSGDAGATANDVVIRNYGVLSGNNASRELYTIQRVGNLVLDNSNIEFLGKGDIVSPTTTKTYSLLNISKHLIVTNASSMVLNASVEQTHSMGSYSCTNAYTLDTVAVNYNGLNNCDNKIFFNNGCFVNINYDKNGTSTYGRLTGFFHAMASTGHSGFAFARPKVNNNAGDAAYAGWSAYAPLNTSDGGFVSYTASENTFNAVGGNSNNGVQMPYKHHPTNRDDSPFYRIWTTGEGVADNDVVITAVATGDSYDIITASASTELPRISSNDGCSYYRITNIEWSDAAHFVNAGIYNNVPQYGHLYYDGNDITLSYGQTAAQCAEEINIINENPNYTFGLTMIPTSNITFKDTDGSTVPAIVLSEDGEEYYSTTGNEIKMYPDAADQAKSKVTFMLTYSNSITSTQSFSPVILTIEEVDCNTGEVLMVLDQSINIQTSTKIQDIEATVFARMYGNGPTHDSTSVKVVLPTWILTSGEEYSSLTIQNITNTPVAAGATRRAATYFNSNTGTTNDFGMTYKPTKLNDNTLGWLSSDYLSYYFDNQTVVLPKELGRADGRDQVAINFTVHYNGQAHHNEAEDELSKQIFHVKMTNYEGGNKEFDITIHIRRRGQAQNWYISSTGSNANNGQYPDKPKRSIKALQSADPAYVSGDNIFVVGAVNINAHSDWDGSFYDNEMRIFRYPGYHELSTGSMDGNNPYLGTMFNINSELHADYIFIDGMYGCTDTELNPGGNLTLTAQGPVFNISDEGVVVFHKGSISNNRVSSNEETAGAILMTGEMFVDGNVVIENNTLNGNTCNVVMTEEDTKIGIENALTAGSHIGVTKNAFATGCAYTPVAYSIEEDNALAATTYNEGYFFADNESDLYYNSEETECTNPYTIYIGVSDLYETACDSYEWNGTTYTMSGDYNYTDPVTGVTTTLHLTIDNSATHTDVVEVCDSYTWIDGITYTESNSTATYVYGGAAANGCDSIVTLNLTINKANTGTDTQVACDSYTWIDGVTYTESNNTATHTLTNVAGCDSVVTLNLTINKANTGIDTQVACDSYTWIDGVTYTESNNTATHTLTNVAGCDSVVTLNLTINKANTGIDTQVACDSYTWIDGVTYTESNNTATFTETNAAGCDSVVTLNLTINKSEDNTYNISSCESYDWHGTSYTQGGTYTFDGTTEQGCSLHETLILTIDNTITNTIDVEACESYTWTGGDGQTYTESGTHEHTFTTAACDSTVILNLSIFHNETAEPEVVEACESYTWNGTTYSTSGTYTYEAQLQAGCIRTETLNLTIHHNEDIPAVTVEACESYEWNGETYNESGTYSYTAPLEAGCIHTETLNLTIHHNEVVDPETVTACGSYEWNGTTYNESGTYTYVTPLEAGCTRTETLNLTIYQDEASDPEVVSACESYTWNGETYTTSGTYTHEIQLEGGCVGIETLQLTIYHNETIEPEVVETCGSYIWHGETYTESGTYEYVTDLEAGCTRTETLNLTINDPVVTSFDVNACDIYIWNNVSYNEDGDYSQTLTAANGCDSIVNIHLTLTYSVTGEFSAEACDHYIWNNIVYANTGDFNQTFAAANGCDSIVTLHLTIKAPVNYEFDAEECPGFTWNGSTYTMSGDYSHTFVGSNECDSIVTMHLTIKDSPYSEFSVVACDSYVWDGIEYTADGNYYHTYEAANGCDSTVVMLLTLNTSPVANITGDLWVATGVQDSTTLTAWGGISYLWSTGDTTQSITVAPYIETTYYVTVTDENGCSSTVEATVINSTGIGENAIDINVYPNPTKQVVNIEAEGIRNVRVSDMLGQVLIEKNTSGDSVQIDLSTYAAGQYFLQVYTTNGMVTRKIVKR